MDPITTAAASGMRARLESLDMLANNLANSGTAGYKVDREFYSLYQDAEAAGGVLAPVIDKPWTDFSQGMLQSTGRPLDLALDGKGFFAVNGPSGPLYTRNGAFRVAPSGDVTTAEGYPLRIAGANTTLRSTSNAPIEISADGSVTQGGAALGKLELVDFGPGALAKQGTSYFRPIEGATPAAPTSAQVQQGKLESSNVPSAESAVRLVSILRQFEMLQRAITIGGEMNKRSLEEVARVGQ
ncbi:MAG TPA: flagellar hook basal-body protein [Bryobacteraceae bacterium]|nr:flagellar hook basal-body protein [Bryobacteraceae bacterium]